MKKLATLLMFACIFCASASFAAIDTSALKDQAVDTAKEKVTEYVKEKATEAIKEQAAETVKEDPSAALNMLKK